MVVQTVVALFSKCCINRSLVYVCLTKNLSIKYFLYYFLHPNLLSEVAQKNMIPNLNMSNFLLRYTGFYQFTLPTLALRDPELIKQITVKDFDHFTDHRTIVDPEVDPLWGGNLFSLKDYPILDEIILLEDRYLLLDILPENLPLELTIPKINDEIYWKKHYIKRWPKKLPPDVTEEIEINHIVKNGINDLNKKFLTSFLTAKNQQSNDVGNKNTLINKALRKSSIEPCKEANKNTDKRTWKKCYIEMHVKEYLENLKPENYEPEKIKDLCDLCGSCVELLRIDQMLSSENSANKIPLNAVLTGFPNLKELCLCFKQTYADEDFSWNIVNTSYQDIKLLAKGLEKIRLQTIRIVNSDIDCEKIIPILKALLKHELEIMEFSHCKIGNRGMMAISKFILENPVKEVSLANNRIGSNGIITLAYAVTQESVNTKMLDLKLNQICDDAGNLLINSIGKYNKTLISLSLSGCGFSKNFEVEKLIKVNQSLENLDISNNALGEEVGKKILEEMAINKSLKKLDVRMCKISSVTEAKIQDEVHKNRKGLKKRSQDMKYINEIEDNMWSEEMIAEMEEIFISQDRTDTPQKLLEDTS